MMYNENSVIEYDSILNKPHIEECEEYLQHQGVKGQKGGVSRYKNYAVRQRNDFKNNKIQKKVVNNTTFIATMRKDFKTIERLEVSEKRYR